MGLAVLTVAFPKIRRMATLSKPKTVLITGCATGFGRQMVTAFLEEGWNVLATARRVAERRNEFQPELARFSPRLTLLECDVTSDGDRRSVREFVENANGLDCLVNNAGYMLVGSLEDTDEEQLRAQVETNFFGVILLTRTLLPALRKSRGTIVNVSSVFGFTTWPLTSTYCATKWAIEGMTQGLRQELQPHGVRVVLLEPGSHPTNLMRNIHWGNQCGETASAYLAETIAYRKFRQSLAKRKETKSSDVARTAVRVACAANPRMRYPIGIGSKIIYLLVRLCPELVGVRVLGAMARRIFRAHER